MNRQTIIAIVLGVVAVIVVVSRVVPLFTGGSTAAPTAPAPQATATAPPASPSRAARAAQEDELPGNTYARLIARVDVRNLGFEAQAVRDPFRPLVGPGSVVREQEILDRAREQAGGLTGVQDVRIRELALGYKVHGILWSDTTPLALVNDQVLGVGEEIEEGGVITTITPDTVVFTYEGQTLTLHLNEEE